MFVGALALRLALGVWAPIHINGQGPLWIGAAAVRPDMLVGYGPGYPEVFAALTALPGAPDLAIFATNATAAALVPVLAFVLARIAGLERTRALFAAIVLAIDPIAVRLSASESYFVPIIVLTLGSSTAIAASVRAPSRIGALVGLFVGVLLATQAVRIHPVAWIPVAMVPLAALFPRVSTKRRLAGLLAAAALLAVALALTRGAWLDAVSTDASRYLQGTSHRVARPLVMIAIGIAAVIARVREWPLVLVAALSLALDAVLRPIYGQSEAWQASFDRLFLVVPVLAAVAILPSAAVAGRARLVLPAAAIAFAIVLGWPLRTRTTEQVEYRWLRDELARLDPACRVASTTRAGQRVHYVPWYAMPTSTAGPARWLAVHAPAALVEAARGGRCVVWLHASICENADGRPLCDAIEAAVTLDEIASVEIDAVPSAVPYPYDVPVVRVSLSRAR